MRDWDTNEDSSPFTGGTFYLYIDVGRLPTPDVPPWGVQQPHYVESGRPGKSHRDYATPSLRALLEGGAGREESGAGAARDPKPST